ncbi:MAG: hypothetical protein WC810_24485 [Janthinobacterium sp.]|jgi:hypothetical protein
MKYIETTATKVNQVKQLAKKFKKEKDIPHLTALEEASRLFGYDSYHHVNHCYKETQAIKAIAELNNEE